MWVFGYGSLIWKADFPYEKTLVGHIKGYVRRFYQKSTDHRGVPSRPGRVVTLLSSPDPEDEVWGVAYKISSQDIENVVRHLDFREKGGYERKSVLFHPSLRSNELLEDCFCKKDLTSKKPLVPPVVCNPFHITIYIGGEDNPNYAGVEDIDTIARQILLSHGPSGSNTEYLYNLAAAMRKIAPGITDEHLFDLEAAVRKLESERGKGKIDDNSCKDSDR